MKYFTAALYEQFNSRDIDTADAADTLWDQAEARYKVRLSQVRRHLPAAAKALADELCLHDADLINLAASPTDALILARQQNTLFVLGYHLTAPASIGAPRQSPVFSEQGVRWLYDEVDMPKRGEFSHDVLLSNGQEIGLVFDEVRVESCEVHPLGTSHKLALTERILEEGQELAQTILMPGGKQSSGLAAMAKELRGAIRQARKEGFGSMHLSTGGTRPGKATTVTVYGLRESSSPKAGTRRGQNSAGTGRKAKRES